MAAVGQGTPGVTEHAQGGVVDGAPGAVGREDRDPGRGLVDDAAQQLLGHVDALLGADEVLGGPGDGPQLDQAAGGRLEPSGQHRLHEAVDVVGAAEAVADRDGVPGGGRGVGRVDPGDVVGVDQVVQGAARAGPRARGPGPARSAPTPRSTCRRRRAGRRCRGRAGRPWPAGRAAPRRRPRDDGVVLVGEDHVRLGQVGVGPAHPEPGPAPLAAAPAHPHPHDGVLAVGQAVQAGLDRRPVGGRDELHDRAADDVVDRAAEDVLAGLRRPDDPAPAGHPEQDVALGGEQAAAADALHGQGEAGVHLGGDVADQGADHGGAGAGEHGDVEAEPADAGGLLEPDHGAVTGLPVGQHLHDGVLVAGQRPAVLADQGPGRVVPGAPDHVGRGGAQHVGRGGVDGGEATDAVVQQDALAQRGDHGGHAPPVAGPAPGAPAGAPAGPAVVVDRLSGVLGRTSGTREGSLTPAGSARAAAP